MKARYMLRIRTFRDGTVEDAVRGRLPRFAARFHDLCDFPGNGLRRFAATPFLRALAGSRTSPTCKPGHQIDGVRPVCPSISTVSAGSRMERAVRCRPGTVRRDRPPGSVSSFAVIAEAGSWPRSRNSVRTPRSASSPEGRSHRSVVLRLLPATVRSGGPCAIREL